MWNPVGVLYFMAGISSQGGAALPLTLGFGVQPFQG
jgi:hypothetical protein